jgi:hypothetical protein
MKAERSEKTTVAQDQIVKILKGARESSRSAFEAHPAEP